MENAEVVIFIKGIKCIGKYGKRRTEKEMVICDWKWNEVKRNNNKRLKDWISEEVGNYGGILHKFETEKDPKICLFITDFLYTIFHIILLIKCSLATIPSWIVVETKMEIIML